MILILMTIRKTTKLQVRKLHIVHTCIYVTHHVPMQPENLKKKKKKNPLASVSLPTSA